MITVAYNQTGQKYEIMVGNIKEYARHRPRHVTLTAAAEPFVVAAAVWHSQHLWQKPFKKAALKTKRGRKKNTVNLEMKMMRAKEKELEKKS